MHGQHWLAFRPMSHHILHCHWSNGTWIYRRKVWLHADINEVCEHRSFLVDFCFSTAKKMSRFFHVARCSCQFKPLMDIKWGYLPKLLHWVCSMKTKEGAGGLFDWRGRSDNATRSSAVSDYIILSNMTFHNFFIKQWNECRVCVWVKNESYGWKDERESFNLVWWVTIFRAIHKIWNMKYEIWS